MHDNHRLTPSGTSVALISIVALLLAFGHIAPVDAVSEARVRGVVLDDTGEPIEGVAVTIRSESGGTAITETTDEQGEFTVLIVDATHPPYRLTLEKEGYQTVKGQIPIEIGDTKRREFTMPQLQQAEPGSGGPDPRAGEAEAIELYNEGAALSNEGDHEGATAKFREAVTVDPDFAAGWQRLADLAAATGDYETALEAADRWLELAPENQEAQLIRYDALLALDRQDEATALIDEMLAAGGGPALAKRLFNLGVAAKKRGEETRAIEYFEKAVESDPEFVDGWLTLASVRLTEGRHRAAIEAADRVLASRRDDAEALTVQYEAYKGLGETERADELLEKMGAASDDPQILFRRGVAMFNASNYTGAIDTLRQALTADPDLGRAHYVLGLALVNQGDTATAKEHLQRFVALAPDDPDAAAARQMIEQL